MKLYKSKFRITDVPFKKITVGAGEQYAIGIKIEGLDIDQNTMYLRDGVSEISADAFEGGYAIFKFDAEWDTTADKVYGVKYKQEGISYGSEASADVRAVAFQTSITPVSLSAMYEDGVKTITPDDIWMAYNTMYYQKEVNTATVYTTYQNKTIQAGTNKLAIQDADTKKIMYVYGQAGDVKGWVATVESTDPKLGQPIQAEDIIKELPIDEGTNLCITKKLTIPAGTVGDKYVVRFRYLTQGKELQFGGAITVDVADLPIVDWEG